MLKPVPAPADRDVVQIAAGNPVRLVAIVAVAAVAGGGMLVLRTTQGGEEATPAPKLLHTTAKPAGAQRHTKPTRKTGPASKPARGKPAVPPVLANGLPRSVTLALARNPVVVVSVFAPRGRVDELAVREARAGAALAGAGFVQINAFRQDQVAPLASKFAFRGNPAVIVIRRPADVSVRIDGFVDRDSVAQAVSDARQ